MTIQEPVGGRGRTPTWEAFWGEMAPCDHSVQLYEDDAVLMDTLAAFVAGGLKAGEGVVVILTPQHRRALESRLAGDGPPAGFSLSAAVEREQYIALDAAQALSWFMVDGWPDEALFLMMVQGLLTRARAAGGLGGGGRRVRAFGEMVALLWAQGQAGATVRLERLWNQLCGMERFSLFCAYPRAGFTRDAAGSIRDICAAHSRTIPCRLAG